MLVCCHQWLNLCSCFLLANTAFKRRLLCSAFPQQLLTVSLYQTFMHRLLNVTQMEAKRPVMVVKSGETKYLSVARLAGTMVMWPSDKHLPPHYPDLAALTPSTVNGITWPLDVTSYLSLTPGGADLTMAPVHLPFAFPCNRTQPVSTSGTTHTNTYCTNPPSVSSTHSCHLASRSCHLLEPCYCTSQQMDALAMPSTLMTVSQCLMCFLTPPPLWMLQHFQGDQKSDWTFVSGWMPVRCYVWPNLYQVILN